MRYERVENQAERAGFEPAIETSPIRHFQCRSFSHSDTSPLGRGQTGYRMGFTGLVKKAGMSHHAQQDGLVSGLIVVDKPLGLSSMDVVRRVRRAAAAGAGISRIKKMKTGHAGTLDPLATGVVICCVGKATKAVDQLMGLTKVYETTIDLSAFTTTDDREGQREEVAFEQRPTLAAIEAVLECFVGEIDQTPPVFSAVHVNGQRAYKLARRGEAVQIKPRRVRIDKIELLGYDWPCVSLRITCGKGVYIRSLGRDLGETLGTGGHLVSLRRTAVGPYDVDAAHPIDRFERPITQEDLLPIPSLEKADGKAASDSGGGTVVGQSHQ